MANEDFERVTGLVELTSGGSLRIMRGFADLSRNALAERSGIPQSTISATENGRTNLSVDRAKALARALRCHPAVLVPASWDIKRGSAT